MGNIVIIRVHVHMKFVDEAILSTMSGYAMKYT